MHRGVIHPRTPSLRVGAFREDLNHEPIFDLCVITLMSARPPPSLRRDILDRHIIDDVLLLMKKDGYASSVGGDWRREWDSNPRYGFPHTRFPSVRLKPLGHLSGGPLLKGQD